MKADDKEIQKDRSYGYKNLCHRSLKPLLYQENDKMSWKIVEGKRLNATIDQRLMTWTTSSYKRSVLFISKRGKVEQNEKVVSQCRIVKLPWKACRQLVLISLILTPQATPSLEIQEVGGPQGKEHAAKQLHTIRCPNFANQNSLCQLKNAQFSALSLLVCLTHSHSSLALPSFPKLPQCFFIHAQLSQVCNSVLLIKQSSPFSAPKLNQKLPF